MLYYPSYIKSAAQLIEQYNGQEPLANYLKKQFAANKKYGSKDRKYVAALCYNFYRMGKNFTEMPLADKVLLATFLCGDFSRELIPILKTSWIDFLGKSSEIKAQKLGCNLDDVFPFKKELSKGIDFELFALSIFQQPKLFLRVRTGYRNEVSRKLKAEKIEYNFVTDDCIALPNGTKIDELLEVNKAVVVQDYSSQQTLNYIKENIENFKFPNCDVWDCCAASGGKSILCYDIILLRLKLTVSDIRFSILQNLHKRFIRIGLEKYDYFICNLQDKNSVFPKTKFTTIICDAPCSGSGTWGRTPEQIYFFKKEQIEEYANTQKQIVSNVIPFVKDGGYFFYITCSVFAAENEKIVAFIKKEFHLKLLKMELLKGYDKMADTMFVAVFKKV